MFRYFLVLGYCLLLVISFWYNIPYIYYCVFLATLIVSLVHRFRKFNLIILILLFASLWPFEVLVSTLLGLELHPWIIQSKLPQAYSFIAIPFLMLLFLPVRKVDSGKKLPESGRIISSWTFFSLLAVCLFVVTVQIKGQLILGGENGGMSGYIDNLEKGSGVIEYVLLIFAFLSLQCGTTKIRFLLLNAIMLLFAVRCIGMGFRIQGTMAALLLFHNTVLRYFNAFSLTLIFYPISVLGMFLGLLKHTDDLGFEKLLLEGGIESTHIGTTISATVALERYPIDYVYGILSPVTMIVPPAILKNDYQLLYPSAYAQNNLGAAGGMPFPVLGYLFLGYVGLLLFSILFYLSIRLIVRCSTDLDRYLCFVIFVYFPRWMLYDFVNYGLRMMVLALFFYLLVRAFDNLMYRDGEGTRS